MTISELWAVACGTSGVRRRKAASGGNVMRMMRSVLFCTILAGCTGEVLPPTDDRAQDAEPDETESTSGLPDSSDAVDDTMTDTSQDIETDTGNDPDSAIWLDTSSDRDSAEDSDAVDSDSQADSETASLADPCAAPEGYAVAYCADYETDLTAADYLNDDVWWFYDGGSATDHDNPELDRRFIIEGDPAGGGGRALHIIKFDTDEDYSGLNLNPRAELSMRPSQEHSASLELLYRMKTFFPPDQVGVFSAEFTQFWLHGEANIPLQIEVRDGVFKARRPGKTPVTLLGSASLADNAGRWIEWEVQAKFNRSGGYWRVFKDGVLAYEQEGDMADWPDDGGTWHTQYGAYANNGGDGTMEVFFDDYLIAVK